MYNKSQSTKVMCILLHLINNKNHWTSIPDNGTHHVSSPFFARHVLLHLLSSPLGIFEDLRCRRFTPPPVEMVVYTSTSLVLWLLGCLKTRKKWMEQMVEMVGQRCPTHCFWQFQTSQLWNKNTTSCLSYHVHHVNIWQNDVTSYMGWDSRTWYWVKGPGNMNAS